jgi:Flp pilus assembly pilin Flp
MVRVIKEIFSDGSETTAMEYGLLVAWIALAVILALAIIGLNLSSTFNAVFSKFPGSA